MREIGISLDMGFNPISSCPDLTQKALAIVEKHQAFRPSTHEAAAIPAIRKCDGN
jgi:hypothetical protein